MAVLDFPSNPSSGDSYTSPVGVKYRYNGYAWDLDTEPVVGPEGPAGQDGEFIILDVPPENPDVGTTWFDSTTGRSFIWYLNEDGNGQWVEHSQPIGPQGPPAPGGTPIGTIAIWSGSIESIPPGWMPCDGVDGRPDLRDKFIVGAGNTYAVGATGGSADAVLVAHSHTVYAGSGTGDQSIPPADGDGNTGEYAQTTSTAGEDGVGKNLPPYFALFYIIKVTGDITDGPVGPVGPAGPQGEVGPQGIQGEVGPIGPQGLGVGEQSVSGNGYMWIGNLLWQWGSVSGTAVTWPIAFPNGFLSGSTASNTTGNGGANNRICDITNTGANIGSYNDSGAYFIVVGY